MPTIRISDQNYQRLQQFAVPLEETPNDALGRVLDLAELAKQRDLSVESTSTLTNGPRMTADEDRLDVKLGGRLLGRTVAAKEGSTMTRWELTRTGQRFWLTKSGVPLLYRMNYMDATKWTNVIRVAPIEKGKPNNSVCPWPPPQSAGGPARSPARQTCNFRSLEKFFVEVRHPITSCRINCRRWRVIFEGITKRRQTELEATYGYRQKETEVFAT